MGVLSDGAGMGGRGSPEGSMVLSVGGTVLASLVPPEHANDSDRDRDKKPAATEQTTLFIVKDRMTTM